MSKKTINVVVMSRNRTSDIWIIPKANQLVTSAAPDGKVTKYAYDAAGRMVREGKRTYRYGYLDKVLSVKEGKNQIKYGYHVDGQLATVTKGKVTEEFLWDGLVLVKRGTISYVNEPHPGGGAPVASSDGGVMFNDILGTTLGVENAGGYASSSMTAFGDTINCQLPTTTFFTGKPHVDGLGHAFLLRNYRADLGKWPTADPLGYPDGWNQMAYCRNGVTECFDFLGGWIKIVNEYDSEQFTETIYRESHYEGESLCYIYDFNTCVYHHVIGQNMKTVRRWENIDGLADILRGVGYGFNITTGVVALTGVGSIPAGGIVLGGVVCHTAAEILDRLNGYEDVPDGSPFELSKEKIIIDTFELHVME